MKFERQLWTRSEDVYGMIRTFYSCILMIYLIIHLAINNGRIQRTLDMVPVHLDMI